MGTTSDGLWYPDGTDTISPLNPVLAAMQTSVGGNPRMNTPAGIHRVTDAAGLTTLFIQLTALGYPPSALNPVYAHRTDNGNLYVSRGGTWELVWSDTSWQPLVLQPGLTGEARIRIIGPTVHIWLPWVMGSFAPYSTLVVVAPADIPEIARIPAGYEVRAVAGLEGSFGWLNVNIHGLTVTNISDTARGGVNSNLSYASPWV